MITQATIILSKGVIRLAKRQKKIRNPHNGGLCQDGARRQVWTCRKCEEGRPENPGPEGWDKRVDSSPTKQYGSSPTNHSRKLYQIQSTLSRRGRTRPTWRIPPISETSQASRIAPTHDLWKNRISVRYYVTSEPREEFRHRRTIHAEKVYIMHTFKGTCGRSRSCTQQVECSADNQEPPSLSVGDQARPRVRVRCPPRIQDGGGRNS
jgi:hypothetical protein